MTPHALSSSSDYQTARSSSYSFARDASASADVGGSFGPFGFSASASAQYSFNRDSSSNSAFKLLTQEKGEIVISQVNCCSCYLYQNKFCRPSVSPMMCQLECSQGLDSLVTLSMHLSP